MDPHRGLTGGAGDEARRPGHKQTGPGRVMLDCVGSRHGTDTRAGPVSGCLGHRAGGRGGLCCWGAAAEGGRPGEGEEARPGAPNLTDGPGPPLSACHSAGAGARAAKPGAVERVGVRGEAAGPRAPRPI